MIKTIYLVRHGNTFDPGQTPLRVGCGTDLPLSVSGKEQLAKLAHYIATNNLELDHIYASPLLRAQESAQIIYQSLQQTQIKYLIDEVLNEVDYGLDEGKPETEVIQRIGQKALTLWEEDNIVPSGWHIQPELIIKNWQKFINDLVNNPTMHNIMLITSNGVARFLPLALKLQGKFTKLATGSISKICLQEQYIEIAYWNKRP